MVDEFSDTFAWSNDELRGIPTEMVEHHIRLILGARPIREKKKDEPTVIIVGEGGVREIFEGRVY